jgi:hypothetical protein
MSKKTTTTNDQTSRSSRQFNPASLSAFNALQPQIAQNLLDPSQSPFFQQMQTRLQQLYGGQAAASGARGMAGVGANLASRGVDPSSAQGQAMYSRQLRQNSGAQGAAWQNAFLNSQQAHERNTAQMMQYQPLQEGEEGEQHGTQVQTVRDPLGQYVIPLASAAIGGGMAALSGGAAAVGGMGMAGGGSQAMSPWFGEMPRQAPSMIPSPPASGDWNAPYQPISNAYSFNTNRLW